MSNIEILQQTLRPISIDDTPHLSKETFNTAYGYPGIPVLFSAAFQNWSIKEQWTPPFLEEHLTTPETISSIAGDLPAREMTLAQYLRMDDATRYYYKTKQHTLQQDIAAGYAAPDVFNCWYAATNVGKPRMRLSWLYVGAAHSYSDTHRDLWGTSAWNYLVSGKKLWIIYPPAYAGLIQHNREKYSLLHWNGDVSAALDHSYKPLYCIQHPGTLVFVPNNCYHAVYNLELSVSVTENFMNETNYDEVRSFMRKGANKKNIRDIESIIRNGFETHIATSKK